MTPPDPSVVVVGHLPGEPTGLEDGPYNWPPEPVERIADPGSEIDVAVVVGDTPGTVLDTLAQLGSPVVAVVVGNHDVAQRVALLQRGVQDVVAVPVASAELSARVHSAHRTLELTRQRDAGLDLVRHANRQLERFASAASHDLKEPLRSVTGFARVLEERYAGVLDDAGRQYLSFIIDGAERLESMITALLELSRMAQQPIEVAEVDVTAAVEGVLGRMRPDLEATQTTVELALEDLPTAVPTDPTMLDTCLRHLLGNAAKFVSSDRQPVVTVSGAVGDDWIGVTVADNGIGVAEEDADRMFDMFSRLNGREDVRRSRDRTGHRVPRG